VRRCHFLTKPFPRPLCQCLPSPPSPLPCAKNMLEAWSVPKVCRHTGPQEPRTAPLSCPWGQPGAWPWLHPVTDACFLASSLTARSQPPLPAGSSALPTSPLTPLAFPPPTVCGASRLLQRRRGGSHQAEQRHMAPGQTPQLHPSAPLLGQLTLPGATDPAVLSGGPGIAQDQ